MKDIVLPVLITLTREAPRRLDDDNNVTAFKKIRDTVASFLIPGLQPGRADDSDQITWKYSQEKSKECRIIIEARETE